MATNFELYDICVKTLATYNPANSSVSDSGFMSTYDACISVIHTNFETLDSERRKTLKNVLFQFAVSDSSIYSLWHDYKFDNKCPDLTIEDYVNNVFIRLVGVDLNTVDDYTILPISADMEVQIVQSVFNILVQVPPADKQIND